MASIFGNDDLFQRTQERLLFNGFAFNRLSFNGSVVILHLHCIMEDSEVFCPHCKEYVAPRTFRRHKALYYKGERTWDLDVPSNSSSDEESSTPVNYDNDHEEASYDEVLGYETEGEEEEEYMEVDLERARETIEFWKDAIEDVIIDFEEDAEPAASLSSDAEDMERTYLNQLSLVKWICLFLLFWTARFQISDNALELMLRFFNTLFTVCQRYAPWFGGVVMFLPTSIYFLRKRLGLGLDRSKYVVCPNCHSLYNVSSHAISFNVARSFATPSSSSALFKNTHLFKNIRH